MGSFRSCRPGTIKVTHSRTALLTTSRSQGSFGHHHRHHSLPFPRHIHFCFPLSTRLICSLHARSMHVTLLTSPHLVNLTVIVFQYHCCFPWDSWSPLCHHIAPAAHSTRFSQGQRKTWQGHQCKYRFIHICNFCSPRLVTQKRIWVFDLCSVRLRLMSVGSRGDQIDGGSR